MTRPLGIDPGDGAGAAAVIIGGEVETFGWKAQRKGYDVWLRGGPMRRVEHYGPELLAWVARMQPTAVALEAVKQHGPKRGIITLAESAGICELACILAGVVPERPIYQRWQLDVLGFRYDTKEPERKRGVIGTVLNRSVVGEWPAGLWRRPTLPVVLTGDVTEHEADAVCMALWVDGWRVAV